MELEPVPRSGVDFAQYAEVLGLPTSQMIAVAEVSGYAVVTYSPLADEDDPDGLETAWFARMKRDHDRILRLVGEPEPSPFSVAELCAAIARARDWDA